MSNLYVICIECVWNTHWICDWICWVIVDLASVAWERGFVNPTGGNFPKSWHKKSSRDICNSHHKSCKSQQDLFEISLRDFIIKSSRDTHHHSASHISLCVSESSREYLITSSRDYQHIHTYIDISTRLCYNMYIHIEITARALCTRNATRSR